jgi:hypothetical protein
MKQKRVKKQIWQCLSRDEGTNENEESPIRSSNGVLSRELHKTDSWKPKKKTKQHVLSASPSSFAEGLSTFDS